MSSNEEKINEFLKQMGFISTQLQVSPQVANTKVALVNHMGVLMQVYLFEPALLRVSVTFGFVPKVNVAPFFRRLLTVNETMAGAFFCIGGLDNSVRLQTGRLMEGLDFSEFKAMLDVFGQLYWQFAANLVQEFQLPQQPG